MVCHCFPKFRIRGRKQPALVQLTNDNISSSTRGLVQLTNNNISSSTHADDLTLMLPDDVVVEILSRIPAIHVAVACRKVCVRWRCLTSSPEFVKKHANRSTPTIFLQRDYLAIEKGRLLLDLYAIDHDTTKGTFTVQTLRSKRIGPLEHLPWLNASCDGLLLFSDGPFKDESKLIVDNLVTQESEERVLPSGTGLHAFGIFLDPTLRNRYLLLLVCLCEDGSGYIYYVSNFGGSMLRVIGKVPHKPDTFSDSVIIVNGILYWKVFRKVGYEEEMCVGPPCSESMMMFDPVKEELSIRPHPGISCCSPFKVGRDYKLKHGHMHIFDINGALGLSSLQGVIMEIWVLEDVQVWKWVKKYEIDLVWGLKTPAVVVDGLYSELHFELHFRDQIHPLSAIKDEELLIWWSGRGLCQCHLKSNTVKNIDSLLTGGDGTIHTTKTVTSFTSSVNLTPFRLNFSAPFSS